MSHPNIFEVFQAYMKQQGVDFETQNAFAEFWDATNSPNLSKATRIPCPQCFINGVADQLGIKTTGAPEGYPLTQNKKELEYFKCAFCKTRFFKLAE